MIKVLLIYLVYAETMEIYFDEILFLLVKPSRLIFTYDNIYHLQSLTVLLSVKSALSRRVRDFGVYLYRKAYKEVDFLSILLF